MTPLQEKDRALHRATWALGAGFLFCGIIAKRKCRCGTPPNTDGVQCNACQAFALRETFMEVLKETEAAHDCDKVKT
jgi:hypothetical protein